MIALALAPPRCTAAALRSPLASPPTSVATPHRCSRHRRRRNSARQNTELATPPHCRDIPCMYASAPTVPPENVVDDDIFDAAVSTQNVHGWVRQFAQLFATGTAKQMCAERLNKPMAALERVFQLPVFQTLVREYARESATNGAERMLAASGVDTLLVVMQIRDDVKQKAETRLKACAMLLPHTLGLPTKTPKAAPRGIVEELLNNSSADESLESVLDQDILSKLAKHPELAPRFNVGSPLSQSLSGERRPVQGGAGDTTGVVGAALRA